MGFHLKALNKKQEQRRIALGRPGEIKDTSIMSLEEGRAYKEELRQALLAEGKDVADLNADSFDDLTDRENPDFFYVSGVRLRADVIPELTSISDRLSNSRADCVNGSASFFSLSLCMDKPVTLLCRAIVISSQFI